MNRSASPYGTLPDCHIRLLLLQPSTSRDAQVECHLLPTQINERPYEALSYVWGSSTPTYGISVEGQEFNVGYNLYSVLKELRLTEKSRTMWIDSICINQSNIDERNTQVRQMGAIYSSAAQVVVWLGEGDGDTDLAMDFIERLSVLDADTTRLLVKSKELSWEDRFAHRQLSWEDRERVFHALGLRNGLTNCDRIVEGLAKLEKHAWWTRVWTAQEIVLCRSACLRCGARSASWDHLGQLAMFALEVSQYITLGARRPTDEVLFDEMTARVSGLYLAAGILNLLSYGMTNGQVFPLEQVISQLRLRQATELVDVIYALLALSGEKSIIDIDYGKGKKQVYKSAMRAMLQRNTSGLSALMFLRDCYLERDPTLPSWVPDFGILYSTNTWILSSSAVGATAQVDPLYNASLGDTGGSSPKFFDDDDTLAVEGTSVDEVRLLGDICSPFSSTAREDWEAQLLSVFGQWHQLIPKKEEEYVRGGSLIEAFWRTVTFDFLLIDREYMAKDPDRRDKILPKGAIGTPPTNTEEEAEVIEGILHAPDPKSVLFRLPQRRFFVTKNGYLGLGPASTQTGDIVFVLRAYPIPFLVRPATNNRYTIVGECYVHGIMDGEMVEAVKNGQSSWQPVFFI